MKKYVIIAILLLFVYSETYSIPAFARQYRLSCQTCHIPAPRLKAYGDEFAGNGFIISDQENPRYYVETGDDFLSLIRDIPIAFRFDLNGSFNNSKNEKYDFATPYILKVLSGGPITDNISYYLYFFFTERGEVSGIEDAYIMFNNLFGIDLDLYVGQFQVSDPLFKREVRLTFEDYQIYGKSIGFSSSNLTYDRGIMLTLGLETGTDLIFEMVNGNGIGPADFARFFDNDKNKNFALRISQDIADFLRVGAFGYWGKQDVGANNPGIISEMIYYGPDLTLSFSDIVELNLQYLLRRDNEVLIEREKPPQGKIITNGGFAELIVTPSGDKSKQYGVILLNYIDSDYRDINYKSATVHIGHLLRRNMRLFLEYSYIDSYLDGEYSRILLGLSTAF